MAETSFESRKLYDLDMSTLQADPNQPRKHFSEEALAELTNSLKEYGVLQPILFRVDEKGQNVVVAGERRFRAAQNAGLATIPAIYIDGKSAEIALVENILREDLTAIEEAEAIRRMQDEFKYTHDDLSRVLGMSRTSVTEILNLNRLPDEIKDDCRNDTKCSVAKLIEISREKSPKRMIDLYQRVKKYNLSREELKKLAKKRQQPEDILEKYIKTVARRLEKQPLDIAAKKKESIKAELENLSAVIRTLIDALGANVDRRQ